MPKAVWLFVVVTMTVYFLPAQPAATAAVYGSGNDSCSDWTENRDFGDDRAHAMQWVLGYLSGTADNGSVDSGQSGPDEVMAWLDTYCRANPQHTLSQAARGLSAPPGISIAGSGSAEGELVDQAAMNEICRNSFPNRTHGSYPVRWATTTDFREYSTSKGWNHDVVQAGETVALRAESTIFSADGRAYDQATGALTAPGQPAFPGAVVMSSSGSRFAGRKFMAKPLCAWGPPNPDLR